MQNDKAGRKNIDGKQRLREGERERNTRKFLLHISTTVVHKMTVSTSNHTAEAS